MKMNKGICTTMSVLTSISLLFASCSSKRYITISGNPGTEIFIPSSDGFKSLGNIQEDGKVKVTIDAKDKYHPYLLAKSTKSPLYVPFGVDYKYKSNAGTATAEGVGLFVGSVGFIAGLALMCASAESSSSSSSSSSKSSSSKSSTSSDSGDDLLAAGGIMYGVGTAVLLGMGLPAALNMSKTDVKHSFRYLDSSTNNDMILTCIPSVHTGEPKLLGKKAVENKKSTPVTSNKDKEESVFTHTVVEGETLVSIAQQYGVSVAAIIKANKLTGNTITIGQQLVIPL